MLHSFTGAALDVRVLPSDVRQAGSVLLEGRRRLSVQLAELQVRQTRWPTCGWVGLGGLGGWGWVGGVGAGGILSERKTRCVARGWNPPNIVIDRCVTEP